MTEIKAKVKVGTLKFEQGTFSKGDIITVTEERFKLFDPADVELVTGTTETGIATTNAQELIVTEVPEEPKQAKPKRAR